MKKKIAIIAMALMLVVASLATTYAIWPGDVEKEQSFVVNMTNEFSYVECDSTNLIVDGNAILTPLTPVSHKFQVKVKGDNLILKLECLSIQFSVDGGLTYKDTIPGFVGVAFKEEVINTGSTMNDFSTIECRSTISFTTEDYNLPSEYENAKFKYSISITVVGEVGNE